MQRWCVTKCQRCRKFASTKVWKPAVMQISISLPWWLKGGRACVNLAMVRGGRHLGDRSYSRVLLNPRFAQKGEIDVR